MINHWIKYNHFPLIHPFTGCPNASYYGDNCSTQCHQNCSEGRCDIVDGTCLGCILGYTGPTCDIGWNTLFKKKYGKHNKLMIIVIYSIIWFILNL